MESRSLEHGPQIKCLRTTVLTCNEQTLRKHDNELFLTVSYKYALTDTSILCVKYPLDFMNASAI